MHRSALILGSAAALALAAAAPLAAQDDVFHARIVDATGGAPVAGARANFDRGQAVAVADSSGRFAIGGMPPGNHDVVIERLGYAPLHQRLRVNEGDTAEVVFRLTATPTELSAVTATVAAVSTRMQGFEFRRTHSQGSGRFLTRQDLEQNRQSSLSDLIRRMPGAQIVNSPTSNAKNLASGHVLAPGAMIRAAPPCFAQVFVDGVQIYGMTLSRSNEPPNLDDFHVDDLEAVEYYGIPASTPPEFRSLTSQCGTLVLWTREAH